MKRSFKMTAATVLTAFSVIGLFETAFAADQGWKLEGNRWVYLDANGDKVTSTFKSSGNEWFYLGDDGELVKDDIVEHNGNFYYLDEDGVMKKNNWVELPNDDDDEEFGDTAWYYFQASGKACVGGKKDINGQTYIFDDRGRLLYGWVISDDDGEYTMADKSDDSTEWVEATYYCGGEDDGAMVKGKWRKLRVYDPSPSTDEKDPGYYEYWFYFNTNGKKYRNESDDKSYVQKTIAGVKYAFANDGHMLSEWIDEDADSGEVKYFGDPSSGARASKGWFKAVPSEKVDAKNAESGNNAAQWYYADTRGNLYTNAIKTIDGKRFLFDSTGAMRAGLYYLVFDNGELSELYEIESVDDSGDTAAALDTYTLPGNDYIPDETSVKNGLYYFGIPADTDGAMKTGSTDVTIAGETIRFKFSTSGSTKGVGINGRDDSAYYINGRMLKADENNRFDIYGCTFNASGKVATISERYSAEDVASGATDGDYCVISSTGTIVKSGTKKDGEGYRLTMRGYALVRISAGTSGSDVVWKKE